MFSMFDKVDEQQSPHRTWKLFIRPNLQSSSKQEEKLNPSSQADTDTEPLQNVPKATVSFMFPVASRTVVPTNQ